MLLNLIFKKPKTFWIIAIGIFLSYIIVGVGVYLWQHSQVVEMQNVQEKAFGDLNVQKEKDLEDLQAKQKEQNDQLQHFQNNEIDLAIVKVGDKLANGMVVGNILKEEGKTYVEFTGRVVVSGDFNYYNLKQSNDISSAYYDKVCLDLDKESLINAPKIVGQTSPICFSNADVAKSRFGPPGSKGETSVVIDNYRLSFGEAYPFDGAELIKIIEITK